MGAVSQPIMELLISCVIAYSYRQLFGFVWIPSYSLRIFMLSIQFALITNITNYSE
jgi:hypothetical protein